jgi:aerobic carbon-monoxide dehydrogenase medium subunit
MIAQNFEYVAPTSLGEAVNLLQKHGGRAKILAGGHSLIPMMKLRLAAPEFLIDIGRIPELSYIKEDAGRIRIGALTTHYTVESSDIIRRRLPALADAAGLIGDIQVRNKGTIGGSIAHADPAADYPASILAFDATIVTLGTKGERLIPASKFFVDMLTTALEPNEVVREIQIPVKTGKTGGAYLKMAQKASGFAICGAAAVVELDGSGALSNVAVGITGVGNRAFRSTKTETALKGTRPSTAVLKKACEAASEGVVALDDIHASADYRLDLARIFARRALEAAIQRAS